MKYLTVAEYCNFSSDHTHTPSFEIITSKAPILTVHHRPCIFPLVPIRLILIRTVNSDGVLHRRHSYWISQ